MLGGTKLEPIGEEEFSEDKSEQKKQAHPVKRETWLEHSFYLSNVKQIKNYHRDGTLYYPAVPIVNRYDSAPQLVRLGAKRKIDKKIFLYDGYRVSRYRIIKFLSLQKQSDFNDLYVENQGLIGDEQYNSIHIKGHYALAPNAEGYEKSCRTLVIDEKGNVLVDTVSVYVHDGLASPPREMPGLRQLFLDNPNNDFYFISCVVDDDYDDPKVLITYHCILYDKNYEALFCHLDRKTHIGQSNLSLNELLSDLPGNPIKDALEKFSTDEIPEQTIVIRQLPFTTSYDVKCVLQKKYGTAYKIKTTRLPDEKEWRDEERSLGWYIEWENIPPGFVLAFKNSIVTDVGYQKLLLKNASKPQLRHRARHRALPQKQNYSCGLWLEIVMGAAMFSTSVFLLLVFPHLVATYVGLKFATGFASVVGLGMFAHGSLEVCTTELQRGASFRLPH